MYHKVDPLLPGTRHPGNYVVPEAFEEQLKALKRWNYESVTLEQWIAYRKNQGRLPPRPIIITFDDGYRSTYDTAWPALRRHGLSATVFLVSSLIGKTNAWDSDERQEALLDENEIREMQRGGTSFGSHTRSHRALTKLPLEEAARELADSRQALESLLGRRITTLCYPFAKQNQKVRLLARKTGYEAAVIGRGGKNRVWTDVYALRRIKVDTATTIAQLSRMLGHRVP